MQETPGEWIKRALEMDVSDLDQDLLDFPVIDGDGVTETYVKFMSDGGVLDDLLGDRFDAVCTAKGVTLKRDRPRAGWFDATTFPVIAQDWLDNPA
jgi:hypothetical protein